MDWLSTIVGAAIGFVSSIGIIIVQRLLDRAGKIEIYAKASNRHSYMGLSQECRRYISECSALDRDTKSIK